MNKPNVFFPYLEQTLYDTTALTDRISMIGDTIQIDCYTPKEGWYPEAWEEHMVLVKPRVLTRESFKEAYRISRIIAKAFKAGVDAVVPTRTRAGGDIDVELRPDAPFRVHRGTATSAGWFLKSMSKMDSLLSKGMSGAPITG